MKKKKLYGYLFLVLGTIVLSVLLLSRGRIEFPRIEKHHHTEKIQTSSDTIKALIFYHAADYFVYQGRVIGYQYDLIKQMGEDLGCPVQISVENDPEKAFLECLTNNYDVVSFDFDMSRFIPEYIEQSEPTAYTYPVLITRKGHQIDSTAKQYVVHAAAKYSNILDYSILPNPERWTLEHHKDVTAEDLFEMLADSTIDYLVCNFNVAITMLPFYKQLSLGPRIGDNFPRRWILNRYNTELNDKINKWLREFEKTPKYQQMCEKYLSRHSYVIERSFGSKRDNISSYDKCMKLASARCKIDWRFMSSIIYQESHFCYDVLGMGGSFGIMQMMPATCERYGITDSSSVEEQLWAGARYIASLYKIFAGEVDSSEIYYFVAGAYNSGPGHILDAMALCKKHEGDYQHWQPVSEFLILKSRREYYNDPVVKCGYYPGKHTVNYVDEVMNRYNGYVITKKEE